MPAPEQPKEISLRDQLLKQEEIERKTKLLDQAKRGEITLTDAELTSLTLDLKALTRTTRRMTIGDICVVEGYEPNAEREACCIVKDRGKHSLAPYGVQWLEIRTSGTDVTVPGTKRLFVDGEHRARKLIPREPRDEFAILDQLTEEQLRVATDKEIEAYRRVEKRIQARQKRRLDVEDFSALNNRVFHPRCPADHLEVRFVCGPVARDPGKKGPGGVLVPTRADKVFVFKVRKFIKNRQMHNVLAICDHEESVIRRRVVFEAEHVKIVDLHSPSLNFFRVDGLATEFFVDPDLNDSAACFLGLAKLAELCGTVAENEVTINDMEEERNVLSSFFNACQEGDNEAIKRILAHHGTYPLARTTKNGNSGLHIACEKGHLETVKLLSSIAKCDQEAKNHHVRTPLHIATIHCRPRIVRYLLLKFDNEMNRGLDANLVKDVTSKRETAQLAKYIARSAAPLNVDSKDFLGWTPLHYAVDNNSIACVKALLTLGQANPLVEATSRETPHSLAVTKGVSTIIELCTKNIPKGMRLEEAGAEASDTPHMASLTDMRQFQKNVKAAKAAKQADKPEIVGLTMNVMGRKMRVNGPRVYSDEYIPASELRKVYRK